MAVYVSFFTPRGIGAIAAPGLGSVRAMEAVAVGSTSTNVAAEGEAMWVFNDESSMVLVAAGTTPVATSTTSTLATNAGAAVPSGLGFVVVPTVGDKLAVAAAS